MNIKYEMLFDRNADSLDVVKRSELGGVRHRYLFETARAAWSKVEFDEERFLKQQGEEADGDEDEDTEPQSPYTLSPSPTEETEETEPENMAEYEATEDGDVEMDADENV